MPPVTYAARTGIEEEERRRGRNTWVRVHASLQPLFLGENDAAAEKGMPYCCDTPRLPPHTVCVPGTSFATTVPNQCTVPNQ